MEPMDYIPDRRWEKLLFLALSVGFLCVALVMLQRPAGMFLFGARAEAQVTRIVRIEPGREPESIRYRRSFSPESDWSVRFQHYVTVRDGSGMAIKRLAVDSRIQPNLNVNDRVSVMFHPGDTVAMEVWNFRSWGIGLAYALVGLLALACSLPTYLAVGKPIAIDPDAVEVPESGEGGLKGR